MQIQNFQLSVTPLGSDRYLIRTEQVEPGVPLAEAQVTWPVADWLTQAQQAMDDPLVSLFQSQPTRGLPTLDPLTLDLRQLGQTLYDALFVERLRDSWVAAQSIAHHQRATLRLRLGLRGDRLTKLPWEVLHTPATTSGDQFQPLTTGTEVLFSRYQAAANQSLPNLPLTSPLKILMVVTQPEDLSTLNLPQEIRHLKAELERGPTPAQLTLLEQPSRHDLAQVLEQGQFHVFHYAGHSNLSNSGGTIHLVSPVTGGTESLSGDDLAGLLVNNGVQLAVFNSCRSSDTTFGLEDEQSLSQALVKRGVPAVLAMAEQVPDEVSLALTRLLYRNVLQGQPLDLALSRARQGLLSSYGSGQLYWALPVLYLHPQSEGLLIPNTADQTVTSAAMSTDTPNAEIPDAVPLPQWLQDEIEQEATAEAKALQGATDAEAAAFVNDVLGDFSQKPTSTEPAPSPVTVTPPVHPGKTQPRSRWIFGGTVAAIALAVSVLGWQLAPGRPTSPIAAAPLKLTGSQPNTNPSETAVLTQAAIEAISQDNYSEGLNNAAALLDRNAVPYANSVLNNIPPEHLDDPAVSYLRGRLAWQAWQTKDANYDPLDARRYWETAVRRNESIAAYHLALGFAYHHEGRSDAANQSWQRAIAILEQQTDPNEQELLQTYAGLAIGLKGLAAEPSEQRVALLAQAEALRDRVLSTAPDDFTTDALAQNWLWTEDAIAAWTTGWSL